MLPDDQTLAATVVALEEHGFSVEVVDDLAAAREAVLARVPEGSSVMLACRPPTGQPSSVGKILEIHQELPGRIHIVLIRQPVGF